MLKDVTCTLRPTDGTPPEPISLLSVLLAAGARVGLCKIEDSSALVQVTSTGHVGLPRRLLRSKAQIDSMGVCHSLVNATGRGDYDVVATLLEYGADPDFKKAQAILLAVENFHYKVAVALLAHRRWKAFKKHLPAVLEHALKTTISVNACDRGWSELLLHAGASESTGGLTAPRKSLQQLRC